MGNPFRKILWGIVDYLYFILAAVAFPNASALLPTAESIIPISIQSICCLCLCYMSTKKPENTNRKQFVMYILCVLIPLTLKMIIDNNTNVTQMWLIFLLMHSVLCLVCFWDTEHKDRRWEKQSVTPMRFVHRCPCTVVASTMRGHTK